MIVKNVPQTVLEQCAARTGVVLYEVRNQSTSRTPHAYQFTLRPTRESYAADHYVRKSDNPRLTRGYRRVFAVCWHGHAVFMANVFTENPNAQIHTTFTKYTNASDFLARYSTTDRDTSHGALSIVRPASTYKNACLCDSEDQYSVTLAECDLRSELADLTPDQRIVIVTP